MPQTIEFSIERGDIRSFGSDVVAIKYAPGSYGTDEIVKKALSKKGISIDELPVGEYRYLETWGSIQARHVLCVGVPPIHLFDYQDIQRFTTEVLGILADKAPDTRHLAMTIHGIGSEPWEPVKALRAQFTGYLDAIQSGKLPPALEHISVVETDDHRVEALRQALEQDLSSVNYASRVQDRWAYRLSVRVVFLSYSHRDKKLAEEVIKVLEPLKRQGIALILSEGNLLSGTDWTLQFEKPNRADIILLLISPDFLTSSYHKREIQQALKLKSREGGVIVIPVILRPVSWRATDLDELQALPTGGKPISTWPDISIACFDVAQGVRKAVAELTKYAPPPSVASVATEDMAEKKHHLAELENELRHSYYYMRDYEGLLRLSSNPMQKQKAQKSIEKRLEITRRILHEYIELANAIDVTTPDDIIQDIARFEDIVTQKM